MRHCEKALETYPKVGRMDGVDASRSYLRCSVSLASPQLVASWCARRSSAFTSFVRAVVVCAMPSLNAVSDAVYAGFSCAGSAPSGPRWPGR